MNFTETFNDFSARLSTMDLVLYAGIGLVVWVLFKDQLSPVQKILLDLFNKVKGTVGDVSQVVVDVPSVVKNGSKADQDLFFDLVVSWKQTRDLAEKSGCSKAVEVADQMFPYLSPTVCGDNDE
jgi:hypothetical protein